MGGGGKVTEGVPQVPGGQKNREGGWRVIEWAGVRILQ